MRITNNMMTAKAVWNLNQNLERLSEAQERASTQSKIQLPSDDPVVATRAIKYRNYVAKAEQYQKNVENAASWQEVTDSALSDLGDIIKRLKELTVQASSDTLSDSDKVAIQEEVGELKEQVVDVMNTSYAGRYIFAGYDTDEAPYAIESTAAGDKVTFKGQYLSLGGPTSTEVSESDFTDFCTSNADQMYQSEAAQTIKYNIGFGSQIAVNVEGQDVTGQGTGTNIFDSIDKLLLGLDGATSYQTAEIDNSADPATVTVETHDLNLDDVLTDLDADYERVLNARADLGARMNYVSMAKTRISNDVETYTTLMSNNEDVDVAEASIDLTSAEYVYEVSLTVGAKVIGKSLVDFLT
ncbi:flagellar hook-associated protein 3 FlgL [Hydrogenispora ethanolica]|jgi:flagellar hook-associated protein 3 FlgL|uniref:Flagellar hook-associated protein 3 FlgL n=1 Tax=Hydrogenispora ethanolica TaxID=1082276 RepID=A0A4R1QWL0_HYDET|nr:flagellar hook-associated protein FlgL [Hydrogenispora ethanolica]TCL57883.1 flagellar hook-associated protein 3 FlgL [Hydrogenispora ethanolica]